MLERLQYRHRVWGTSQRDRSFGDEDLQKVCGRVLQVHADAYPNDLPAIASAFPEGPVVYTGGLENHPKVLGELSSVRTLLGNGPKVVEQVRDFTFIRELAHKNGCSYPTTFSSPAVCQRTART